MRVAVVGGGLAGMSSASALADMGFDVEIFERSPRLGGRASSIFNRRLDTTVDTGQHVLLGCCTNLLHFYERLNLLSKIKFHGSYTFVSDGEQSVLSPSGSPEPLHLAISLLTLAGLKAGDKMNAGRLLWNAIHPVDQDEPASKWLARCGQSSAAIRGFWEPILVGALNDGLESASAKYASMVIREGMLLNRKGMELGISQVTLGELHDLLGRKELEVRGVTITTRTAVVSVETENGRVLGVRTSDGELHRADYVIVAGSPVSSASLIGDFLPGGSKMNPTQVPIVTLYLWYKNPLGFPPAACIPGGHFHWCFDRLAITPVRDGMSTSLSLVASAAKDFYLRDNEDILSVGLSDLSDSFGFRIPPPDDYAVVKYRDATFSPGVGCDDVRPAQSTSISNLYLAGEWTKTGWPGTMEGAVRSGYQCAREIGKKEGVEISLPLPGLDWGWKRSEK